MLGSLLGTLGVSEGLLAPVCIALDKVDRLGETPFYPENVGGPGPLSKVMGFWPPYSHSSSSLLLSSLELSDTKVYAPEIRARLGTGPTRG